jgi:hypothetical protein
MSTSDIKHIFTCNSNLVLLTISSGEWSIVLLMMPRSSVIWEPRKESNSEKQHKPGVIKKKTIGIRCIVAYKSRLRIMVMRQPGYRRHTWIWGFCHTACPSVPPSVWYNFNRIFQRDSLTYYYLNVHSLFVSSKTSYPNYFSYSCEITQTK